MLNLMHVDSAALINTHPLNERVDGLNDNNNSGTNTTSTVTNGNSSGNNNDVKYLLGGLKNDGLITSENYTVEIRGGRLIIDGVAQPEEVNAKYQKYLAGKEDMIIKEHKVNK
jgi:hypothetical protein